MAASNYGRALGELILQKRRALGLTQLQLAEDAFSDPTKVRRISDLENGLVANPHPKTIDPITAILKISTEEIEDCAKRTGGKIDPDLDRAYREARNLIEALAYQFEHAVPEASFTDLDQFLRDKATEWRNLRARLDAIDADTEEFTRAKNDADAALATGKFDEVDATLAALEERFQERRTLVEIAKQAEIRVIRGDTCLMREDADGAFGHYLQAARFFQPFNESEMARVLDENAHRVYETSLRTLRPRFSIGIRLLEEVLKLGVVDADPERRTATHYRLGLLCRNAALQTTDDKEENLLQRALKHSRLATEQADDCGDPFKIVSAKTSLANCLLDLSKRHKERDALTEAIAILRSARIFALEEKEAHSQLCHICNSLGGALIEAGKNADAVPNNAATAEALEQFDEAIVNAEQFNNPDVWGAAKHNRARLLTVKAQQEDRDASEREFLFLQAISSYQSAIETYPVTLFPNRYADAHFELAGALFDFALAVLGVRAEVYMFRAVQSFDIAGAIYADSQPKRWAECQFYSGSVIAHHAYLDITEKPDTDFEEAIRRFEAALATYQQDQNSKRIEPCKRAIARAKQELARLNNTNSE